MRAKAALAVFMASLLVGYPGLTLAAGDSALGRVLPGGPADLNGTRFVLETTLYPGDTITTPPEGQALFLLPKGDQVHVGPASALKVNKAGNEVLATLERGAVLARSGSGQTVAVLAKGLMVNPQARALYGVAFVGDSLLVWSKEGAVTVRGAEGTVTVGAGKSLQFELAQAKPPAQPPAKPPAKKKPGAAVPWYKNPKIAGPVFGGAAAAVIIIAVVAGEH